MDRVISLALSDFVQTFCAKFFDQLAPREDNKGLLYDRHVHEIVRWLDENSFDSSALDRIKQIVAILLTCNGAEAQELVDEWKLEGTCKLRAGEILLILNNNSNNNNNINIINNNENDSDNKQQ